MKRLFVLVVSSYLAASPVAAHAPQHHHFKLVDFSRPAPAPAFSLNDLTESPISLADFQGRYVLLNFWATWCVPCVREMPALEKLYQKLRAHGLVVVAIATDAEGTAKVEPFVRKYHLTFPVLLDANQNVSQRYGARDLPSTFLLDPQGNVIAAAKGERDWFSPQALSYMQEVLNVKTAPRQ